MPKEYTKSVSFLLPQTFSRHASDCELEVALRFAGHIDRCSICGFAVFWRGFSRLEPHDLCSAGRSLAAGVSHSLAYREGQVCSLSETQIERLELPQGLQCIRPLLKALNNGGLQCLGHRHSHHDWLHRTVVRVRRHQAIALPTSVRIYRVSKGRREKASIKGPLTRSCI